MPDLKKDYIIKTVLGTDGIDYPCTSYKLVFDENGNSVKFNLTELDNKINSKNKDLNNKIEIRKGELENQITSAKTELNNIINSKQSELNNEINIINNTLNNKINTEDIPMISENNLTNFLKNQYDQAYQHSQLEHFSGKYSDLIDIPVIEIPEPTPVIDDLTTADSLSALSAKQGKILNDTKVNKDGDKVLSDYNFTENHLANLNVAYTHSQTYHFSGKYSDLNGLPRLISVADNLFTEDPSNALSAKQGKILNDIKVNKEGNKVLSDNNFTEICLTNLNDAYQHSQSYHFSGKYSDLTGKPNIPDAYVLPVASSTSLGGIKVGDTLKIENQILNFKYNIWIGTQSQYNTISYKDENTLYFIRE